MKKFFTIFVLILLFFPNKTLAYYIWIDIEKDNVLYLDLYNSTETKTGFTFYELLNIETSLYGKPVKSVINLIDMDCSNMVRSTKTAIAYSEPQGLGEKVGHIIYSGERKKNTEIIMMPGNIYYNTFKKTCSTLNDPQYGELSGLGLEIIQETWLSIYNDNAW